MKLLELHLRNIASIEKADIDFEHDPGLMDPDTGQPAQMFLIHGDTGTGKSILLDAIAMTLFDQTPRLEGVADRLRNSYFDSASNEISISSIEQYTRIGTKAGDECYSETVFEGNDGIRYRAKMELGYNRKMKSHKKWLLQVGDNPEISGKLCGETIEKAIGMNFTQFCRMAMLAQGQFSAFLCGKRKERADILERLTNTTLFSRYGEAIARLYNKKKESAGKAKALMEQAATYILSHEETELLHKEAEESKKAAQDFHDQSNRLREKLKHLDHIAESKETIDRISEKLSQLKLTTQSQEYKEKEAIVKDWDATQRERENLRQLNSFRKKYSDTQQLALHIETRFAQLSSDLAGRKKVLSQRKALLDAELRWAEENKGWNELYVQAGVIAEQMKAYSSTQAILERKKDQARNCMDREKVLDHELAEAQAKAKAIESTCRQAQQEIDLLTVQRNATRPDDTTMQLANINQAIVEFTSLGNQYGAWVQVNNQLQNLMVVLAAKYKCRDEAQSALLSIQKQARQDSQELQNSLRRYSTLHASLDETLEELRRQLRNGDSDICPLCGQKVGQHLFTHEQFEQLLTPLQQERDAAVEKAERSKAAAEKASSEVDTIIGEINSLTSQQHNLEERVKATIPNLHKLGIDSEPGPETDGLIAERLAQLNLRKEELEKTLKQANRLQDIIDQKQKELQDLNDKRQKCILLLQEKQTETQTNQRQIDELQAEADQLNADLTRQQKQLDNQLASWYPTWANDPIGTAANLKTSASQYLYRLEQLEKTKGEIKTAQDTIDRMNALQDRLLQSHPHWSTESADKTLPIENPEKAWNDLVEQCSRMQQTFDECREGIDQYTTTLDKWYLENGRDELYLTRLEAHNDIPALRSELNHVTNEIATCQSIDSDTKNTISQHLAALQLASDSPLPDRQAISIELKELEESELTTLAREASARAKLKTDADHRDQYIQRQEEYGNTLKILERWENLNRYFGGERFRNLVQTYILHPLLTNANLYLSQISDRYTLTCSEDNAQLSILVLDSYNRNEVRSTAVLSGGERFMISLALSLALSSLNRADMNVNILFIDEGFGTLDQECLDSVMKTLSRLCDLNGQANRRVGIISHREELLDRIPNRIRLRRSGEGRSSVVTESVN